MTSHNGCCLSDPPIYGGAVYKCNKCKAINRDSDDIDSDDGYWPGLKL